MDVTSPSLPMVAGTESTEVGEEVPFRGVLTNAHPAHPKGPSMGSSLPPGGMASFLLTWLLRVPRPRYRVLHGGSQLLSGLGTWPGKV